MEWVACLKQTIEYIENHLQDNISADDIAGYVHMSSFYLQRGFQIVTGYSIGEYMKNRKLYEAACELSESDVKVIDVAFKYGYDTPESFTKAFKRFHGITPSVMRKHKNLMKQFLPLNIKISVQGGNKMIYSYERVKEFTLIGFEGVFSFPSSYEKIPRFCGEIKGKYCKNYLAGNKPENEYEKAVCDNCIGEYGVVINDVGNGHFRYLMAGEYKGGPVPEGMVLYTFKESDWVKFKSYGPCPTAIQRLNTQIFKEWLPGNTEFDLVGNYNVEWYGPGSYKDEDYETEIWLPMKRIQK